MGTLHIAVCEAGIFVTKHGVGSFGKLLDLRQLRWHVHINTLIKRDFLGRHEK